MSSSHNVELHNHGQVHQFVEIYRNGKVIRVTTLVITLLCHHNGGNGISNHQPHNSLLNRFFGHRSMKTSKLHVTGLSARNSLVTGKFSTQRPSNTKNVSIWWRHHDWRCWCLPSTSPVKTRAVILSFLFQYTMQHEYMIYIKNITNEDFNSCT